METPGRLHSGKFSNKNETSTLYGASMLNTPDLTDEAHRLWSASVEGWAQYQNIPVPIYRVQNDAHGLISVGSKIQHFEPGTEEPGEFNGWYVGTISDGPNRGTRLLLPPECVYLTDPRPARHY